MRPVGGLLLARQRRTSQDVATWNNALKISPANASRAKNARPAATTPANAANQPAASVKLLKNCWIKRSPPGIKKCQHLASHHAIQGTGTKALALTWEYQRRTRRSVCRKRRAGQRGSPGRSLQPWTADTSGRRGRFFRRPRLWLFYHKFAFFATVFSPLSSFPSIIIHYFEG